MQAKIQDDHSPDEGKAGHIKAQLVRLILVIVCKSSIFKLLTRTLAG